MKSNLSCTIRFCADGSLKSVRRSALNNFVCEAAAALLLAALIISVTIFILTDPFEAFAPPSPAAPNVGAAIIAGAGEIARN